MSRKAKLVGRAARFSDRMQRKDTANGASGPTLLIWDNAHDGYIAGYKAAMRDLRKVIRSALKHTVHISDPFKRARVRHSLIATETQKFLRPLR
jgi:hypothetical protein